MARMLVHTRRSVVRDLFPLQLNILPNVYSARRFVIVSK